MVISSPLQGFPVDVLATGLGIGLAAIAVVRILSQLFSMRLRIELAREQHRVSLAKTQLEHARLKATRTLVEAELAAFLATDQVVGDKAVDARYSAAAQFLAAREAKRLYEEDSRASRVVLRELALEDSSAGEGQSTEPRSGL